MLDVRDEVHLEASGSLLKLLVGPDLCSILIVSLIIGNKLYFF